MNADHNETEDEKPLDPEMEKVRRKMVRLLGVSLGIMSIGIMAVLAGVIYKINDNREDEDTTADAAIVALNSGHILALQDEMDVVLPLGFQIRDIDLDGQYAAIFGTDSDGQDMLLIVDLPQAAIISQVLLRN